MNAQPDNRLRGRVIGLTGPSGSGKTAVCTLIGAWGTAFVLNADQVAHAVMQQDPGCRAALTDAFSSRIFASDGAIDRPALAAIVFRDPQKLQQLGFITYPYIIAECIRRMNAAFDEGCRAAFLDAPTLFESGADRLCQSIVSVITARELRLQRILLRDGISRQAAEERLKNQHTDDYYTSRSDFVIKNDSGWEDLHREVERCRVFLGL